MLLPPDDDALLGRDVVERVDETPVEVAVAVQRPATRQPAGRPAALVGFHRERRASAARRAAWRGRGQRQRQRSAARVWAWSHEAPFDDTRSTQRPAVVVGLHCDVNRREKPRPLLPAPNPNPALCPRTNPNSALCPLSRILTV